jgi:hypothetical protein
LALGNAAAAHVRLIVWRLDCRHQIEPDPAAMAERYGAEMAAPDWHARLICSRCGSRRVDMVVSGTERREISGAERCPKTHTRPCHYEDPRA